jgi:hypothetical protein
MTVIETAGEQVRCKWFTGDKAQTGLFPVEGLESDDGPLG